MIKDNRIFIYLIIVILLVWVLSSINLYARQLREAYRYINVYDKTEDSININSQKQKIILKHADILTYDKRKQEDVQVLTGNVEFEHGNALMTCDSAYLNNKEQTFNAFGNVHMTQNDTLNIYANNLLYDGKSRMAYLRNNVKLENTTTTIYTDSLDYDRVQNLAYYFNGGSIVDSTNTLISDYGQYSTQTNDAEFSDNVKLTNDRMTLTTDHLIYNTRSQISNILGPTTIVSDSGIIYSDNGFYDTKNNVGILLDRSKVVSKGKTLIGDSIYYDGVKKFGEAFGNMIIIDSIREMELHGDYGYFDNNKNYAFSSGRSYAIDFRDEKDSVFISSDTLELISIKLNNEEVENTKNYLWKRDSIELVSTKIQSIQLTSNINIDSLTATQIDSIKSIIDSINTINTSIINNCKNEFIDTIKVDSTKHILRSYKNVKVFSFRGQAISDSLSLDTQYNIMTLFGNSILWRENNQISADTIRFYIKENTIDSTIFIGKTFSIEHIDSVNLFNQIKAKEIHSTFKNNNISQIKAFDNVESIYYIYDNNTKSYSGLNRMSSTAMTVKIDSNKVKKATWIGPVKAKIYPMSMSSKEDINKLEGFNWNELQRPKDKYSIIDTTQYTRLATQKLVSLRKFNGALAAIKAYKELESSKISHTTQTNIIDQKGKIITSNNLGSYPSYWVLKNKTNKKAVNLNNNLINNLWYFPFSRQEKQEHLTTNSFIGIPEKKLYKKELKE